MRYALLALAAFGAAGAAAQSGQEVRRVRDIPVPPQLADRYLPGDRWARLRLDVDAQGYVTDCRILATNESNREQRFYFCRAFLRGFRIEPRREDGVAVAGSVERFLLLERHNHGRSGGRTIR